MASLDTDIDIFTISDEMEYEAYENIIIGGWINQGHLDKVATDFVKKLSNKRLGFFFTLTAYPTSSHAYSCATNIINLLSEKNEVIDFFWSQGPITKKFQEMIKNYGKDHPRYPNEAKLKRWDIANNHPNEDDFCVATTFLEQFKQQIK